MSLMEKLQKNSKISDTDILADSKLFKGGDRISTDVPMMNVALSGKLDGGLASGLTVLAGPSKHFKTLFALKLAAAFLKKYDDAILLFYDSEFGSPEQYFGMFDIDMKRVLHTPIVDIEQLKFDMVGQLENIDRKDKVVIVIDSVGNLASKKELDDARDSKSVADMTRAKALKGLFRMVTPYLTMRDLPLLAVNHTYETQEMFSKQVVSGGKGIYYSASNIWIVGRRQNKVGTEVEGYDFIINVEKSRFVKEKSKIPISVTWEGGIKKYSGLLEVAVEGGFVMKPTKGWFAKVDMTTGEMEEKKWREKDTHTTEFWDSILGESKFSDFIQEKYKLGHSYTPDLLTSEEE
jgi:RecA/RadA recombinase